MSKQTEKTLNGGAPQKRKMAFKVLGRAVRMLFGYYPVLVPLAMAGIIFSAICGLLRWQ